MNERHSIADQDARIRALDPAASFIIQAPAGSGKTELLTQRFLVLLAGVDAPEEIVAITFTRKAAGEMRQRILQALEHARDFQPQSPQPRSPQSQGPQSQEDHKRHTWELARRALARDREQGWQLLDNPSRLRIQTIDALCTALARQMPILSRFGSVPDIAEDAVPLYLRAAGNTIRGLESQVEGSQSQWSDAIAHLVKHLDNRLDRLQSLISIMLARRDQWLRHLANPDHPGLARENLEAAIAGLISRALEELARRVHQTFVPELIELARFAAENIEDTDSPIAACRNLQSLPDTQLTCRGQWQGLAELLLTREGTWRKRLTKKEGFPAPGSAENQQQKAHLSEMKVRMTSLLESLRSEDAFREQLALLADLPPHQYADDEWETLQALIELLRVAAAHLELVFSGEGQVDFPALSQAAINALGEPEAPTDLALALDYRIRHLLVDEFQDTSFNQYELLKRLTAGWQPEDGHSLFVVGDPMQSIYRFREAEVGLFLAAREYGIGQVPLEFLRLKVNFRSQQGIVDWINRNFPQVLPPTDNVAEGAVSYAPSTPFHPPLAADAVTVYPSLVWGDLAEAREDEALQVVSIVQRVKAEHPEGTIAILVRGRSHLVEILAQLQEADLRFQAVEIESLAHRPVIQDLLALCRAMTHTGDRIAWLAVLRAPYCGLTLKDLHALAAEDSSRPIIDLLHQQQNIEQLSEDGRRRLARVLPLLDRVISERARGSLRSMVEGLWIALGGPACVTNETDLEDAEVYFQLLERFGSITQVPNGQVPDIHELNNQVKQLFALPDVQADDSLQVMTIHKAKGLEFDTVILPGLGRTPRRDEEKLLHWLELGRETGGSNLLLAPISAYGEDKNPMAAYLRRLDNQKERLEDSRLLYVAATRARQGLHLLGHVSCKEEEDGFALKAPPQGSLLARLWPVVENDFQSLFAELSDQLQALKDASGESTRLKGIIEPAVRTTLRTRLAVDWFPPAPPDSVHSAANANAVDSPAGEPLEFDWAGDAARHIGTVVHRLLQHIGKTGLGSVDPEDLLHFQQIGRTMLVRLGVPENRLGAAVEDVSTALKTTLEDERGKWILSEQHQQASCELAISGIRDGTMDHMVIDRTFVDDQGTRWIIDYKTGAHTGAGVDVFLDDEQERYRSQLERYAGIMSKMESRPIRLGLYFPLLGGWRDWPFRVFTPDNHR